MCPVVYLLFELIVERVMKHNQKIIVTNSFEETRRLGEEFAKDLTKRLSLEKALVIALHGDLGSGKTTFAQGLARGLGIKRRIISPTFIIVRSYELQSQKFPLRSTSSSFEGQARIKNFYHIDLYRIEKEKHIEGLGLEEIISNPENIVAIEWAEKMGKSLPEKRLDLRFEHAGEDKRRITLKSNV